MNYTEEDYQEIIWWDHPDYESVTGAKVDDTSRWSNFMSMIVRKVGTEEYYDLSWKVGATEYQECDLDAAMIRVYPKEVTQVIYVTKDKL